MPLLHLAALLAPAVLLVLASFVGAPALAAALVLLIVAPQIPAPLAALARARGGPAHPGTGIRLALGAAQMAMILLLAWLAGGGGGLGIAGRVLALAAALVWLLAIGLPNARALLGEDAAPPRLLGLALLAALGAVRLVRAPLPAHRHEPFSSYAARMLLQARPSLADILTGLGLAAPWIATGWLVGGWAGLAAVLLLQTCGLSLSLGQDYLARYGLDEAAPGLATPDPGARWRRAAPLEEALTFFALRIGLPREAARQAIRVRLDAATPGGKAPCYPVSGPMLALAALRGAPFFAMTDAQLRPDLAGAAPFERLAPGPQPAPVMPDRPDLAPGTPLPPGITAADAALLSRLGSAPASDRA